MPSSFLIPDKHSCVVDYIKVDLSESLQLALHTFGFKTLRHSNTDSETYNKGSLRPRGDSHMKMTGMPVVSLGSIYCRYWFHLVSFAATRAWVTQAPGPKTLKWNHSPAARGFTWDFNILTSLLWSTRVETMENCCRIVNLTTTIIKTTKATPKKLGQEKERKQYFDWPDEDSSSPKVHWGVRFCFSE